MSSARSKTELPSIVVAEDERAIAILDINPINDGHTLIIPRTHAETIFEIAEEDAVATVRLARRVAIGIRRGLRPDGLNLLQNNGQRYQRYLPGGLAGGRRLGP